MTPNADYVLTMYTFVSDQGTAMATTAICSSCLDHEGNLDSCRQWAAQEPDWDRYAGTGYPHTGLVDCTGNEALECQFCGRPSVAQIDSSGSDR